MRVEGLVVDALTEKGVEYANVSLVDGDHKPLGKYVQTNANGEFVIDSTLISDPNTYAMISNAGYGYVVIPAAELVGLVELMPTSGVLDYFSVVFKKDKEIKRKQSYAVPAVLATASVGILAYWAYLKFY